MCGRFASDLVDYCTFTFRKYKKEKSYIQKKLHGTLIYALQLNPYDPQMPIETITFCS